ncbi:hypothetical protein GCM10023232_12230 [Sphingosinicella ginsenosidimutans]|uniref:Uncharacterized protein n=1 Tax=Allosphingosinicella ginsenosidimutans TaxID=1176539 RepID=A0A5C6TPZ4_9SPHN|nr:hypothetical protein [Sphingosinicella ginsenosidimutans]TXC62329.1 hypothetical protein FRZ32_00850 [Sphingosinicella ginsenosidimutans]
MNNIALIAALAAAAQAGPTPAQFNHALNAQCPGHRLVTRNISCTKPDPDAVEYRCTYQLQTGSRWTPQTATLTLSEHEWVWMDGATPCDTGDDPSLN